VVDEANAQPFDTDLPCYQCGYNLRAISREGDCPECGFAIGKSTSLGVIKQWPLTAENACGWLSLGVMTCWVCGLGVVFWLIGLVLMFRHLPNDTPMQRWTNRSAWWSLLLVITLGFCIWVYPDTTRNPGLFVAATLLVAAHYLCVMLLGLRLTRDAKLPFAFAATLLLMGLPSLGVLAFVYGFLYNPNEDAFVTLLVLVLCWLILSGFYWMGISGELGARRLELIRRVTKADRRKIKTKTI